jgi:hypothetical protein
VNTFQNVATRETIRDLLASGQAELEIQDTWKGIYNSLWYDVILNTIKKPGGVRSKGFIVNALGEKDTELVKNQLVIYLKQVLISVPFLRFEPTRKENPNGKQTIEDITKRAGKELQDSDWLELYPVTKVEASQLERFVRLLFTHYTKTHPGARSESKYLKSFEWRDLQTEDQSYAVLAQIRAEENTIRVLRDWYDSQRGKYLDEDVKRLLENTFGHYTLQSSTLEPRQMLLDMLDDYKYIIAARIFTKMKPMIHEASKDTFKEQWGKLKRFYDEKLSEGDFLQDNSPAERLELAKAFKEDATFVDVMMVPTLARGLELLSSKPSPTATDLENLLVPFQTTATPRVTLVADPRGFVRCNTFTTPVTTKRFISMIKHERQGAAKGDVGSLTNTFNRLVSNAMIQKVSEGPGGDVRGTLRREHPLTRKTGYKSFAPGASLRHGFKDAYTDITSIVVRDSFFPSSFHLSPRSTDLTRFVDEAERKKAEVSRGKAGRGIRKLKVSPDDEFRRVLFAAMLSSVYVAGNLPRLTRVTDKNEITEEATNFLKVLAEHQQCQKRTLSKMYDQEREDSQMQIDEDTESKNLTESTNEEEYGGMDELLEEL